MCFQVNLLLILADCMATGTAGGHGQRHEEETVPVEDPHGTAAISPPL